jgi:small neutral amino acid transporter SnatA (MarC family)
MTIASAALLLFLVMDPLGNVPFFWQLCALLTRGASAASSPENS